MENKQDAVKKCLNKTSHSDERVTLINDKTINLET